MYHLLVNSEILKSNFKPSKLQTRPPKYFIDTSLQAKVISLRLFWKIISLQCKNIIGRQEKEITFVSGELSRYSELSNSLLNGQSPKILKDVISIIITKGTIRIC